MTKTKILTFNYKPATLKRADVRKAIKEVNAKYEHQEELGEHLTDQQTNIEDGKMSSALKFFKK